MSADATIGPFYTSGAIETLVPGQPEAFHTLAGYLRSTLGARIESLGDQTATHRSMLAMSWRGQAGETFGDRAGCLVGACDGVGTDVGAAADQIDSLGDTLRTAQEGLLALRATAPGKGLVVKGTEILPGPIFHDPDAQSYFDLPPWEDQMAALGVWQEAVKTANGYWSSWYDAVNAAGGFINEHAGDLLGFLSDLITTGASEGLLAKTSSIMSKQRDWLLDEEASAKGHANRLAAYLDKTGDASVGPAIYNYEDDALIQRYAAQAADAAAGDPHLPGGIRAGLGTITALSTGVGIYLDVHDGESPGQAVVSQGGAAVVGTAAALGTGAAIGFFAGPPGSLAGVLAVGGAELAAGTAAAIVTDMGIDHLWPGGDDTPPPTPTEQYGGALLDYAGQVTHG